MTRLQKKCLIAVAGTHLLAVVVLLCSGFITSRPEPDTTQVLDMIPAKLIDQAFVSGVRGAQPPPPVPVVTPPEPTPPAPTPPPVEPKPEVKPVEPVKPPERIQPPDPKPDHVEPKPPVKHEVTADLKPVRKKTDTAKSDAEAKEAAKEAKRLQDQRAKAAKEALRAIKQNAPTSTTIDMPGSSTEAYADYASVVKTVYTAAWNLPDDTASDDANVKVSVTIANSGRVTEAHIVEKSGDAKVDSSVQRTLDRVSQLEPFPDGSKDRERTYIINFNLKAKRQLLG